MLNLHEIKLLPRSRGTWVAQYVKHITSAQVMISQLMSLNPASGSVLTAQRLEPAWDLCLSLCPSLPCACSLSLSLSLSLSVSLSLSKINIKKIITKISSCFCCYMPFIFYVSDQDPLSVCGTPTSEFWFLTLRVYSVPLLVIQAPTALPVS